VTLPAPRTVTDLASRSVVCRNARQFTVALRPKEVRLFFLDD